MIKLPDYINQIICTTMGNMPDDIQAMSGGLSGANLYQLYFKDKTVVLRIVNTGGGALFNEATRDAEVATINIASKLRITPQIYYSSAKLGVILMEFISHQAYNLNDIPTLDSFALIVQRLHSAEVPKNGVRLTLVDYLNYVNVNIEEIQKRIELPLVIQQLQAQIAKAVPSLEANWQFVVCHNDINPKNLLFSNQRFFLVDWDSTRITDPYIDLACIMNFFLFDPKLADHFLHIYFGRVPNKEELTRLFFMQQIAHYFFGVGFLKLGICANLESIANISPLNSPLEFYKRLGTGEEQLDNPTSQACLGLTMLTTAQNNFVKRS